MGAANPCSYSDMSIQRIDNAGIDAQKTSFQEIFCFRRYRNDCIKIWAGDLLSIYSLR